MIAKRQPDRKQQNSDIARLAHYILRTGRATEVAGINISNCGFDDDPALAIKAIQATQSRNTRSKADPCYHLMISFPEGEKPARDKLEAIEEAFCQAIGLAEHQRISAIHDDTDHFHVHVAINKVHPTTHRMVEPFYDKLKLVECAEQLEIKYNLTKQIDWEQARERRQQQTPQQQKKQITEALKAHSGQLPFNDWVKQRSAKITDAIDEADSWQTLQHSLQRFDLCIKPRGNGAVLSSRSENVSVRLSELGREYTKTKLEQRLGKLTSTSHNSSNQTSTGIKAETRYQKGPAQQNAQQSQLWQDFQQRQQEKKAALSNLQQRRKAGYAALKADYQQRRQAIKQDTLLTGPYRRKAWQVLAASHKTRRNQLKQQLWQEQQHIYRHYPERNWQDYLIKQAEQGNDKALLTLRHGKKNRYLAGKLALSGKELRAGQLLLTAMKPEVRKSGVVVYRHNATEIHDDGQRLSLPQNHSPKATTLALLRMARQQYGNHLTIDGSDTFKQQVVEVAVAEGMPVTFNDPVLERKRQTLSAAISDKQPRHRYTSANPKHSDKSQAPTGQKPSGREADDRPNNHESAER
ncbi:MAG: TraI/MobA(P) family conjugative relaxase [Thiolinea sp.]